MEKEILNNNQNNETSENNVSQKKETIITSEETSKKEKEFKKEKSKKHTFKRYFYGVGKEFERISWTSKKTLFSNFLVVIVVVAFFALIFTGITIGIVAI